MSLLHRRTLTFLLASLCNTACIAMSPQDLVGPISSPPTPQIFAPGVVSGPANDGSPAFRRMAIRSSLHVALRTGE
jgi:hypothetical protein